MDPLTIVTGLLNGGVVGILGNLATAWIHHKDRALDIEEKKQDQAYELQKLEKIANIDLAKLEAQGRIESDRADGEARKAAQETEGGADTAGVKPWRWTVSTRIIWRQALCLALIILTGAIFWSLPEKDDGRDMIATAVVTCTTSAVLFFYGERLREKLGQITLKAKR